MIEKHTPKSAFTSNKFLKDKEKFLHLILRAELGIPFLNIVVYMFGIFKKIFQSSPSIPLFLNYFSLAMGSPVTSAIRDSVTAKLTSPISTSAPSKDHAKVFVTSLWKPSNFSMKSNH